MVEQLDARHKGLATANVAQGDRRHALWFELGNLYLNGKSSCCSFNIKTINTDSWTSPVTLLSIISPHCRESWRPWLMRVNDMSCEGVAPAGCVFALLAAVRHGDGWYSRKGVFGFLCTARAANWDGRRRSRRVLLLQDVTSDVFHEFSHVLVLKRHRRQCLSAIHIVIAAVERGRRQREGPGDWVPHFNINNLECSTYFFFTPWIIQLK